MELFCQSFLNGSTVSQIVKLGAIVHPFLHSDNHPGTAEVIFVFDSNHAPFFLGEWFLHVAPRISFFSPPFFRPRTRVLQRWAQQNTHLDGGQSLEKNSIS